MITSLVSRAYAKSAWALVNFWFTLRSLKGSLWSKSHRSVAVSAMTMMGNLDELRTCRSGGIRRLIANEALRSYANNAAERRLHMVAYGSNGAQVRALVACISKRVWE